MPNNEMQLSAGDLNASFLEEATGQQHVINLLLLVLFFFFYYCMSCIV